MKEIGVLVGFVFSVCWNLIQSYLSVSTVKVDCNCLCKFYFEGAVQVGAFCGVGGIFVGVFSAKCLIRCGGRSNDSSADGDASSSQDSCAQRRAAHTSPDSDSALSLATPPRLRNFR